MHRDGEFRDIWIIGSGFDPRPSANSPRPVVWAVDRDRLRNYLLPRDCPRVTFFRSPGNTTSADADQHLPSGRPMAAIERTWLDRVRAARHFVYQFEDPGFVCIDQTAGYFVNPNPVTPTAMATHADLLASLEVESVELRVLDSLWPLHDAVAGSSLGFSMIRMRNAQPPSTSRDFGDLS